MGYRKDKKTTYSWKKWLKKNLRYLTLECGLPDEIFTNRRNWNCFLDHAFYSTKDCAPFFDVNSLNVTQAKNLYEFLVNEETDYKDMDICSDLKRRIISGQSKRYDEIEDA